MRSRIRRKPVRVQLAPMSRDHDPRARDEHRRGDPERGRGRIAGDVRSRRARARRAGQRRSVAPSPRGSAHAGARQHPLGVVAARHRLDDRRRARRPAGRPAARTTSPARWRTGSSYSIPCSGCPCTVNGGEAAVAARRSARPSRAAASAMRSTGRRRIDSSPSSVHAAARLAGEPAGQRAASACRRCRRRSCAVGAARCAGPAPRIISVPGAPSSTSAPSARTASSVERVSAASR